MAQSSFKIEKTDIPVPVSKGGTGVTSLTNKGVVIGAGTGNVTAITPGTSGNALVSNGTSWSSGSGSIGNATISYSKLASEMTAIVAVSANDIDWSAGSIFTKTLTGNTTLTFSNYKLDKTIVLQISGDFTLSLPSTVNILNGTYDGRVMNYITLHCTKSTSTEEVWGVINNRMVSDYGYGYFAGGAFGSPPYLNITDRIVFSTGVTSANTVSNLSQQIKGLAGLSDVTTYGYFVGGDTSNSIGITTDRIIFSTGVKSLNTVSNLSQARSGLASLSDGSTYGYFAGGTSNGSTPIVITDRIIFSTGVTSVNTVSNLPQIKYYMGSVSDTSTYGYFSGGSTWLGTMESSSCRIIFSTGVNSANTVSNLSQARYGLAGLSDGVTYGYFAGGWTGNYVNTADRIVFSTGVTSVNTVSNLSQPRYYLASSSDGSTYGYFSGGYIDSDTAMSDIIVFSTGVTSSKTASNLSQARSILAGLSSCSV